jgi:hypothetical protein
MSIAAMRIAPTPILESAAMAKKSGKSTPKAEPVRDNPLSGGLGFATVVLVIAGALNAIDGIAALANDSRFNTDHLIVQSLTAWGVLYIVLGALQIYAGTAIYQRHPRGLLMGITFASLSGIAHFMSIGAYPIWSVTVMILNFAVLFALLTNDDAF